MKDLERLDAETLGNSTPESGNQTRQSSRKKASSIRTTDSYEGLKSIPEGWAIEKGFMMGLLEIQRRNLEIKRVSQASYNVTIMRIDAFLAFLKLLQLFILLILLVRRIPR